MGAPERLALASLIGWTVTDVYGDARDRDAAPVLTLRKPGEPLARFAAVWRDEEGNGPGHLYIVEAEA